MCPLAHQPWWLALRPCGNLALSGHASNVDVPDGTASPAHRGRRRRGCPRPGTLSPRGSAPQRHYPRAPRTQPALRPRHARGPPRCTGKRRRGAHMSTPTHFFAVTSPESGSTLCRNSLAAAQATWPKARPPTRVTPGRRSMVPQPAPTSWSHAASAYNAAVAHPTTAAITAKRSRALDAFFL